MNGIGRRSAIVGVALAAMMTAGGALAADIGLSHGLLKAALTAPAAEQASLANAVRGMAFAGPTDQYVLPLDARYTGPGGGSALSRVAMSVRQSGSLNAGGYADSLRGAANLGDVASVSATRDTAQIDLSQLADDLMGGTDAGQTATSFGGSATTNSYTPRRRAEGVGGSQVANPVGFGGAELTQLADALTAGGAGGNAVASSGFGTGHSSYSARPRSASRVSAMQSGSATVDLTQLAGALEGTNGGANTVALPASGGDYAASLGDAARFDSGS